MIFIVEAVIGALLQAAFQGVFERVVPRENFGDSLLDWFRQNHESNEILFQNLKTALEGVKGVLNKAAEEQLTSQTDREWVEGLTDAVNHTADLLDEIYSLGLAASLSGGKSAHRKIIQKSIGELEKMTTSLKAIAEGKDVFGLKESCSGKESWRESTSLKPELYGRDEDKAKIWKNFVVKASGQHIPLIAIIGMAGIGKTALAQLLFNDPAVKSSGFNPTAWVYVSKDFDVSKVIKTLYVQVTGRTISSKIQDLDTLQKQLAEELKKKKFLFVFDDVWNEDRDLWDKLRSALNSGACESRIIVTTRSQEAASTMRASQTHHLRPLNDEDCWMVFAKEAFGNPHADAPTKLKPIAEDIKKKCGGLPLIARALGNLLHSEVDAEKWEFIAKKWESISNQNLFDLPSNKINILAWFRLSYNHLSSPFLKQCFGYCSIIPKGYEFDKEKLILLWMAQGFLLQLKGGRTMEEMGINYFQELLTNSFFQQASDDNKSLFKMHDLINELAQFASTIQPCLVEKGKSPKFSDKTRHVSYAYGGHDKEADLIDVLRKAKFLRTFLPLSLFSSSIGSSSIGSEVIKELQKQKRLRVLSLSFQKSTLPDKIGKLRHLRYLDLSDSAIVNLPETITSLYTLQTLILSHCTNLMELPEKMTDLSNLGHLDLTATSKLRMMPPEFGKLKSLRILTKFVVSNSPKASSISELGELLNLRGNLSISELQNARDGEDAEMAKLKKKKVKELEFEWSSNGQQDQEEVLEKLRPHEDIEKLRIAGYGGTRLPNWLGDSSFSKMVSLRLSDCRNCSSLPSLGQLSSLKELHVRNMPNCKQWLSSQVTGGGYTSLLELYVQNCEELTAIPNNLTSLKTLDINKCRQLKFDDFMGYKKLHDLRIRSCDCLKNLTLNFYRELEYLQIHDCKDLRFIRISINPHEDLEFLKELEISECPNLEGFDGRGLPASKLTSLSVSNCNSFLSMPKQMHTLLSSLQTLDISDCPKLVSFPDGGLPQSLQTLTINNCVKLTPQTAWGLRNMTSLTYLRIDGAYDNVTSFPDDGLLPASLTNLQISNFEVLNTLNLNGLRDLTSLKELRINSNQLQILSDGILPGSLSYLSITGCASLTDSCKRDQGTYWNKISHIPIKIINDNDLY